MSRGKIVVFVAIAFILILTLAFSGCTGVIPSSVTTASTRSIKPLPSVDSIVATTSGTQAAYYATLDIKVKNSGAEGTILVQAMVTQNGKSSQNEMPVFLKQNETHELKLTFPLVWMGGEFTSDVKTIVP